MSPDDATAARVASLRARYSVKDIRQQFGESMISLAEKHGDLVAVTADLMHATGMASFGEQFPERLINVGIAEQNMTGVAAGLAACGKLAVVCGYAAFTTLRAVEQAKVDCAYNQFKVILVGQSAGVSYGVGGPTHQTFEDLSIMRAIPNMIVLAPSDAVELDQALVACANHNAKTPIYLRLGRGPEAVFNQSGARFEIGKSHRLREGDDICLLAHGAMVFEAILAADILAEDGIRAEVLNMHSIKPIDRDAILLAASRVKAMIVAEEHSVHGGLGSAVLEVLDQGHAFPVARIGIEDIFPPIGPTPALREALGLSAVNIVAKARTMLTGHHRESFSV
jgi:transketolase